jgi:signal transduction histidine kinase
MLTLALIISGSFLMLLAVVILISNPQSKVNRFLVSFLVAGLLWLLANLFTNLLINNDAGLFFARFTLVGAVLMGLSFVLFAHAFSSTDSEISKKRTFVYVAPALLLLAFTNTSWNIKSIEGGSTIIGPLYYVLVPFLVAYFAYGIWILIKAYKNSYSQKKVQIEYIFWGVALSFIPGVFLNALLPIAGYDTAADYGPIVVVFFAAFTSLAIIKHSLLDIRMVVARALAYSMTWLSIAVIYVVILINAASYLFGTNIDFSFELIAYVTLGLLLVAGLLPLKGIFNKVTNRLFYQDAYDAQLFIDELNKLLVSTVDIEHLLNGSVEIIERNIKAQYCSFVIRETSYFEQRVLGGKSGSFTKDEMKTLKNTAPKLRSKVIAADDVEDTYPELAKVLKDHKVAVLVRLVTTLDYDVEGIGYIMLGYKKSGNAYTSQDLRVLEIVGNELVISTQNALRFEEIENFNITLQEKIDNATRQLRKTNEKLKTLDETKDEFISMASHQLRTPLTSVKGYLSMVLEGDAGELNEMQVRLLDQAFVSSQRMVYLIADLLNISRLRTGKFLVEPSPVNLANLIEGEIAQLVDTAASRKLELEYEKPDDFPLLMLDETKIRQVVMNFVDNAIYYTPSGGKITVKLEDKGSSIEYRVVDNGIGVPKAEQHHLFTKFYRAGNAKKARPDGTGLGLFMAKKVIAAQGGSIIFESQEDKGSTFGFTFSKEKLAVPENYTLEKKEKKSLKSLV